MGALLCLLHGGFVILPVYTIAVQTGKLSGTTYGNDEAETPLPGHSGMPGEPNKFSKHAFVSPNKRTAINIVGLDTTGDGQVNAYDTNGDGRANARKLMGVDTTGDGR